MFLEINIKFALAVLYRNVSIAKYDSQQESMYSKLNIIESDI